MTSSSFSVAERSCAVSSLADCNVSFRPSTVLYRWPEYITGGVAANASDHITCFHLLKKLHYAVIKVSLLQLICTLVVALNGVSTASLVKNVTVNRDTIRYDMIQEFNMDWKAECGQLNLEQVTKNKNTKKKKLKQTKLQCPLSPLQVQDPWRQSEWNQKDYGGKDLWSRGSNNKHFLSCTDAWGKKLHPCSFCNNLFKLKSSIPIFLPAVTWMYV